MSKSARSSFAAAKQHYSPADDRFNRAVGLHRQGDLSRAEKTYRETLAVEANHVGALHLLGVVMLQTGRLAKGVELIDRALTLKPDYPDAHNNRGNALKELNRLDEAVASYNRALTLKPDYVDALYNRGAALEGLNRFDEALASYNEALAVNPGYAEAHNNRGNVLLELERRNEAVASFDRAIAIRPRYAEALYNRGNALQELNRLDEALASYDRALEVRPDYADALNNRGNVLKELKRIDEGLASYDAALAVKPDFVEAEFNRGLAALLAGELTGGWRGNERRWERKGSAKRRLEAAFPVWQGESLFGKSIVVYEEQGLGDTLHLSRYLPYLSQAGANVTFLVQPKLLKLMASLGEKVVVAENYSHGEDFDYQCALMSLPLAFGTTLANIPAKLPYISAEPERVQKWRERLGEDGLKIGVAWQGSKAGKIDAGRSFAIAELFGVSRHARARLISLQKGDGVEQLGDLPEGMKVETLGDDYDASDDAFLDAAAVMESLDLVIACDTSIAHLAGALARPVWVALKYVPDWRWMLDRTDSPWYPTMRLFRQRTRGDWRDPFVEMEAALRELMNRDTTGKSS